jgi:hypothetical protein
MKKVKLTQSDIDQNPLLKKIGAKAGQVMEYSFVTSGKTGNAKTESSESSDEGGEEDEGNGGNHPPKKGGN